MTATAPPLIGRCGMNAVTGLLLAVAAVSAILAVAFPVQQLTERGASVPIVLSGDAADRAAGSLDLPGLPDGTWVGNATEQFQLTVEELPAGLRLLSQASTSLRFVSVAIGAACLALVLRSIRAGQPFDRRNPARLTAVAGAIVLGAVVAPVIGTVAADTVLGHLDLLAEPNSPLDFVIVDLTFDGFLFAALVLAVAEAFRRGGALAHDVEGLV